MNTPEISVILSTYNAPVWLEKVLVGYRCQTFSNFEIIIADDGSGQKTADVIKQFQQKAPFPIKHVWHKDNGFQKTRILNKAILATTGDYILMSDGDCIPRKDFVAEHIKNKKEGYFLSGGYFLLPMETSLAITVTDIEQQRCFDMGWLAAHGVDASFKNNKLTAKGFKAKLLNKLTPTNASWNGHNASGYKKDILAVNGFDERMAYGGEDREMGERLVNLGIKGKQIRYSAVCIHLDHERGYVNDIALEKNAEIRKETKIHQRTKTAFGIEKLE